MPGVAGRSGGKPKPTHLKAIAGNPGKRALNQHEPPATGTPKMPRGMSSAARAEWHLLIKSMAPGLLALVDQSTLAAHCETVALFWLAQQEIAENGGPTVMAVTRQLDDGMTIYIEAKPHPAVATMLKCAAQIRGFCAEFGLSPSARSRLTVPEASSAATEAERHFA